MIVYTVHTVLVCEEECAEGTIYRPAVIIRR